MQELRTGITTAFVTLFGPTSREGDMSLGGPVNSVSCDYSGVFSGVLAFKEENLRNSTGRVYPIKLEELLECWLGLARQSLREALWRGNTNHQGNCSSTRLRGRGSDNARRR